MLTKTKLPKVLALASGSVRAEMGQTDLGGQNTRRALKHDSPNLQHDFDRRRPGYRRDLGVEGTICYVP